MSGGQSGVDRAALDVAMELQLLTGGWCPAGRQAEDGRLDERYALQPTPSSDPAQRTAWNVRDTDATLIIAPPPLGGGTALTAREAKRRGRPCLIVDPGELDTVERIRAWLAEGSIRTLNVAGPRASSWPEAYETARQLLRAALKDVGLSSRNP
ncbi:MAG: putative molybdenum carrier protein [Planctomycetota bacterium]